MGLAITFRLPPEQLFLTAFVYVWLCTSPHPLPVNKVEKKERRKAFRDWSVSVAVPWHPSVPAWCTACGLGWGSASLLSGEKP